MTLLGVETGARLNYRRFQLSGTLRGNGSAYWSIS